VISKAVSRVHVYTYAEYLAHESVSNVKHEFFDGEIYAMAGGLLAHAALAMSVGAALVAAARGGPCVVFSSDLKVRALATGLTAYPDVTVICGPAETDPLSDHVVINPTLVVEVTSPSTEDWDRGEKLDSYKTIPSLRECVIVSHRDRRIEVHRREADGGWTTTAAGRGEAVTLTSLACTLAVDEIYGETGERRT
jgi:Uma2 family endonuclease